MKIKKALLISLFFVVLSLVMFSSQKVLAMSSSDIKFTPNIPIPGSEKFGGGEVTFGADSGTILALYIRDLYSYGASLAGVVALFMLVFAGWKWLMAAGSSEKVSAAKSVINNVLVGLLLLFGGYLLLSQISNRLVDLRGLVVTTPTVTEADNLFCASYDHQVSVALAAGGAPTCGRNYSGYDTGSQERGVICLGNICNDGMDCVQEGSGGELCPASVPVGQEPPNCTCRDTGCGPILDTGYDSCVAYSEVHNLVACRENKCYGPGKIEAICMVQDGSCYPPVAVNCDSNSDCNVDADHDGVSDLCCAKKSGFFGTTKICMEKDDLRDGYTCLTN